VRRSRASTARRRKLDGIRIQLHRRGDEVRVYSRNLNEITHALPGIVDAVCGLAVEQAVFDGEALWMGERGPAAFQETVAQVDSDAPPEEVVTSLFTLLHVVGDDLLESPLEERGARLARMRRSSRSRRLHLRPGGGTARPRRVAGRRP
jgi:DNA ligase 1